MTMIWRTSSATRTRALLKLAEAELRAEFEQDIRNDHHPRPDLGKTDRPQTGHTSYDLVKQLRGSFKLGCGKALPRSSAMT